MLSGRPDSGHDADNLQDCHELWTSMTTTGVVPVSVAFYRLNHVKSAELLLRLNYQKLEMIR